MSVHIADGMKMTIRTQTNSTLDFNNNISWLDIRLKIVFTECSLGAEPGVKHFTYISSATTHRVNI